MEELTEDQKRGFIFLEKGIKKVFPFIRGLDFSNIDILDYNIYVNIEVDFIKFLKFENVPMSDHHSKYGLKNAKDFFKDYTIAYLFPLVDRKYIDDYTNDYNKKINENLTNIYKSLPSRFTIKNEHHDPYNYETRYYVKSVHVNEYTVYIDEKDIEEDEIKRGNI